MADQALAMVTAFDYDLLVLDLLLPDTDGIELCQQIRRQGYQMPILLVAEQSDMTKKTAAFEAGADDYVIKPFDVRELLARTQALLRRGTPVASPVLEWGALRLNPSSQRADYQGQTMPLTPKEYALLEMFLREPERTFSASRILNRIWAAEDYPGEETVRAHIKGLRQKLRAAGAPANLIETMHGLGYRLNSEIVNASTEIFPELPAASGLPELPSAQAEPACILAVVSASEHPMLRQVILQDMGQRLMLLKDYSQFWPALESHTPALLILSYPLEETVCLDICRTIRQTQRWQTMPIIALLAEKTVSTLELIFAAGANDVIAQPILGPELQARVATCLRLIAS
ncbi:MAG: response regulator transcription factor [Leptolyngbyaceae cyanobacterium SM2_5_2]|nr:response regulator transcription factor [Leptolyngbyaceae cyanobacterium SM2_5_2]